MPDTPAFLSERLLHEGEKSIAFFQALSPDQLRISVYSDGSCWNPHQVLAHFATAEHSLCRLIENIAAGGAGSPEDFDTNRYNERKVKEYGEKSLPDLLEQFRQNRQRTASFVATLKQADLELQGRHPYLGIASLAEIIKIIYRHNQIHQREIRQELEKA